MKPVFRPMQTLEIDLMQVKNRTSEQKAAGVVYEAPCKNCSVVYVDETKWML